MADTVKYVHLYCKCMYTYIYSISVHILHGLLTYFMLSASLIVLKFVLYMYMPACLYSAYKGNL